MQVRNVGYGCDSMIIDDLVWIFDIGLMIKKYDFDKVVLFVDLVLLKSIDFTGVLNDWWDVNRWFFMCYFIIRYLIFGWVRENVLFIRVWGDFWWNSVDFWWCWKWWNAWFFKVLSKSISNSKWGSRCGNIRYAVLGFRLLALKCKLRPLMVWKYTIIVQYYSIFLSCQVKMLYTCNDPVWYSVKWKYLTCFGVRLRCYWIILFTIAKQK